MIPPRAPQDTAAQESARAGAAPPLVAHLLGRNRSDPPAAPAPPPDGRTEWRLGLVALVFLMAFGAVALRMSTLALTGPSEPRVASTTTRAAVSRAAITDRHGQPLALNLPAWSVYAHPRELDDAPRAAERLARVLEGVSAETLASRFARSAAFAWIKRPVTPAERQAVHDLGIPGVYFGTREVRVYPAGRTAAHILGGVRDGQEDVHQTEVLGLAGTERHHDEALRDPARDGEPLRLSIDLAAQAALTDALRAGVDRFNAIGAAGVLMDARTGQVLAMASLPDFDPNRRPVPTDPEIVRTKPLLNRAAQGVYEMGSTFKPFYAALALEKGVVGPETLIDAKGPMRWGRHTIRDYFYMPPLMTVAEAMARSSNVVTARLAIDLGTPAVRAWLGQLGLTDAIPLEVAEASLGQPLLPDRWADISTITIGFGYGLAVTPLHMAAGYAALVNGGLKVMPTLDPDAAAPGEEARILSAATSLEMRKILRQVVEDGTGRAAEAPGYLVGGKTGTAEKAAPGGGYLDDKVRASFVATFPMNDPAYVLAITLDEPEDRSGPEPRRGAGATAAPVTGDAIRRLAPLLGLRPALPSPQETVTVSVAGR